jgi:hypothetical protein
MTQEPPTQRLFRVGQIFTHRKTGERVRISNVTAEFIEWRDEATNSYGRMLRRFFPDFYQFNQA